MYLDEMKKAMQEARSTMHAADMLAGSLADMLVGRLDKVPVYQLKRLKKELECFNAHTGRWKD